MFTYINKQGVKSEQGFIVQRTGRFTAEYIEGLKKIEIEVEGGLMGSNPCLNYSRSSFERWVGGAALTAAEKERVVLNFRAALQFQGIVPIESKG